VSPTLLADVGTLATAPPVLATLVACLVLLGLRAWSGTGGLALSRPVVRLINGGVFLLVALFAVLVVIRFETLA
jgi:hypothetical protein